MGNRMGRARKAKQEEDEEPAGAASAHDARRSSIEAVAEDPELPPEVQAAFDQAYKMRSTALQGEKMGAMDVEGVFIKALEMLRWSPERAVPLNEVCDGMKRRLGKRGKLKDEAAFFTMFTQVALAPEHATEFGAVLEDTAGRGTMRDAPSVAAPPVAATAVVADEQGGPSVRDSPFKFTRAATRKAVNSPHPCFLWTESWKRKLEQDNKRFMLPGYAYAFENASESVLKFQLDFSQSENWDFVEPALRSVTRDDTKVTRVVKPSETVFIATITQESPEGGLGVGLKMKVTDIVDKHIYM